MTRGEKKEEGRPIRLGEDHDGWMSQPYQAPWTQPVTPYSTHGITIFRVEV